LRRHTPENANVLDMSRFDWRTLREALGSNGAIVIRGGFSEPHMQLVDAAFQWMVDHPGPGAEKRYTHEPATFYESTGYAPAEPVFAAIFQETPIVDMVRQLYAGGQVWYLGEQLFWKHGGYARRTPWHQDLSYLPFRGESVIGVWISLGDLPRSACLEFVRGSHRGALYNGASYLDLNDDTHPLYPDSDMPRLPDIQANRDDWDILSWPVRRGDLIIFHLGTLHGGGGTTPHIERRSLTLRFFGADAVWTEPLPAPNPAAFAARRAEAVRASGTRPTPRKPPLPGEAMHLGGQFAHLTAEAGPEP
jgi:ectoine hydroxylase-related dioxygenase (phytanoyl-CoA dioxygenase family)